MLTPDNFSTTLCLKKVKVSLWTERKKHLQKLTPNNLVKLAFSPLFLHKIVGQNLATVITASLAMTHQQTLQETEM